MPKIFTNRKLLFSTLLIIVVAITIIYYYSLFSDSNTNTRPDYTDNQKEETESDYLNFEELEFAALNSGDYEGYSKFQFSDKLSISIPKAYSLISTGSNGLYIKSPVENEWRIIRVYFDDYGTVKKERVGSDSYFSKDFFVSTTYFAIEDNTFIYHLTTLNQYETVDGNQNLNVRCASNGYYAEEMKKICIHVAESINLEELE